MSQIQCRVTPITKLTAVSSNPSVSGRVYPLSAVDHAMARHSAAVVMYYSENPFGSFILDPMRESLSKVLTLYPTVTGRLTRSENGNWAVKGNDAGVRVTMTKVGTTLDEWLRSADSAEERDLAAIDELPEDPYIWSPFRIQINEFEGGGVAIGVSFTHLIADPTSATFLLKTWADAHRGKPVSPPLFTRPSLSSSSSEKIPNIATKSTNFYAHKFNLATTFNVDNHIKMSSITFKFSNTTINQCLSKIKPICPNVTPFDFLASLFWKQILKIKSNNNNNNNNNNNSPKNSNHSLSIFTDIRKNSFYFGNAQHISQLTINNPSKELDQLGHIVELVHKHLEKLGESEEEIWSMTEWLESQKDKDGRYTTTFQMYGPELSCVNMERNESLCYATKFVRDSKPVHVSYNVGNVEGEGLIIVMPSNEGGVARNVMVMLPSKKEMDELCEDETILSLNPTMILGGRRL